MAYCTATNVKTLLSTEGLASMMDDQDQSRYTADIEQIIDWASARVDQFLLPRYPNSLANSVWVNWATTVLATRQFAIRRLNGSTASLDADYEFILKELGEIRDGTSDLAGIQSNSLGTPGVRNFRYDGRRFPQKVLPQQTTSSFGPSNIPQAYDWSDWIPSDWGGY